LRKEQEAVYDAIANSPHKSQDVSVKIRWWFRHSYRNKSQVMIKRNENYDPSHL
jgi:hypothetical protein